MIDPTFSPVKGSRTDSVGGPARPPGPARPQLTPVAFAKLVIKMRAAQNEYWRGGRTPRQLAEAKRLEHLVDVAAPDQLRQPGLPFGDDND